MSQFFYVLGKSPKPGQKRKSVDGTTEPASKRKRVSFGPKFSPELFDKKLPASTPLRRGATPRRKSAPSAGSPLKGLIKRHSIAGLRSDAILEESPGKAKSPTAKSSRKSLGKSPKSKSPGSARRSKSPGKSPRKTPVKSPKAEQSPSVVKESPAKSPKAPKSPAGTPKATKSPAKSPKAAVSPAKSPKAGKSPAKSPRGNKSPGKTSAKSPKGKAVTPAKYASPDKPASPVRRRSKSPGKALGKPPSAKKPRLTTTPKRELASPPEDFKKAVAIRAIHGKDATPKLTAAMRRRAGDTKKGSPIASVKGKTPGRKVSPSQATRPKLWSDVVRTGIATKPAVKAVAHKVTKMKKTKAASKPKAKTPKVKVTSIFNVR